MGRRSTGARPRPSLAAPLFFAALVACGGAGATTGSTGSGGSSGAPCAKGQVEGGDGGCLDVGIAGCAARFVDDDGVCRPSLEKCEKGTIPTFDKGCTAIGIAKCHPKFVGADGLCHATMSACAKGTYAVPEQGCVPIDGAEGCGDAPWGPVKDAANTVYVDPSYPGGDGDGSKAKPLATLVAGYAKAPGGGRVVLAAGHYPESLHVDKALTIEGRCPSMVTIDGDDGDPSTPTVLFIGTGPSAVRGVRLSGDGIGVYAHGTVVIDRVHIDATLGYAITTDTESTLTVSRTLIEGVRPMPTVGGDAVALWSAVQATIDASAIVGSPDYAITTSDPGTHLTMTDSLVEGTLGNAAGELGPGLVLAASSSVELSAVAFRGNHDIGAQAAGDSTLSLTGCVVEGTLPRGSDHGHGVGVELFGGANVTVDRSAILENHAVGVLVGDAATELTLTQSLVADTAVQDSDQGEGFGLQIGGTAHGTITDTVLARNHTMGLVVTDGGTELTATRLLVEATAPQTNGQYGLGAASIDGGLLRFASSAVVDCKVAGIFAVEGTADVTASIVSKIEGGFFVLRDPRQKVSGVGDGALASRGGELALTGVRIEGCARAGILYDASVGSVTGSSSSANAYGVVVDGSPTPSIDTASAFTGNEKGGKVDDAKLPVPNAPATLPE